LGVYQTLSSPFFDAVMQQMRSKGGALPVPQRNILRHLVAGKGGKTTLLLMVADQAPGADGAIVLPFLQTETGFFSGPETLSSRFGAKVYYISVLPGVLPHTYVSRFVRLREGQIVEDYVQNLEKDIRAAPHTYLWSHNRFKRSYKK